MQKRNCALTVADRVQLCSSKETVVTKLAESHHEEINKENPAPKLTETQYEEINQANSVQFRRGLK
jgi:hypothetical protein